MQSFIETVNNLRAAPRRQSPSCNIIQLITPRIALWSPSTTKTSLCCAVQIAAAAPSSLLQDYPAPHTGTNRNRILQKLGRSRAMYTFQMSFFGS